MYTTKTLQEEILKQKKEQDLCILAHAYQSQDIWEIADYVGDSYGLSRKAAQASQKTILMCGVRFMAETVKILSPDKRVILSHPQAGCPMAEQMSVQEVMELKKTYPGYALAAYVNTTAELKTVCDICVTSSCAVDVIRHMENQNILFIPDCNLGAWTASQVPEKNITLVSGGCPVHAGITVQDVQAMRAAYPEALVLVHPECVPQVTSLADFVGSTTEIMDYAKQSSAAAFLIGTENSIVQHLQFACQDKRFYALSKNCVCHDMKLTTLMDVYRCVCGSGGEEIVLSKEVRQKARQCLDAMLELSQ
ncbi:MAG: quinolinate synthase NadA [Eubacterium sp.]|nr:quinolinate synthase NadA [Eubacterium sp.]